ncbi:hypothetical protein EIK77_001042 [Talaromyces pinophilus]|nr:hypothetical protein EIK77_001042 [Talaromyces pinophilus]
MEQSTPQPPQGNNAQSAIEQSSFPDDIWNNMDGIFPELDVQQSDPQMQSNQQQGPQGITWDHPIFTQTNHQSEQQPSFPQQNDHIRDFYSGTPQAWGQPTSSTQTVNGDSGQAYGLSHQHPYPIQQQFPQDQVAYNSRTISPENLAYQYAIPGQYYQQPGLQSTDPYAQQQPRHQAIAPRPPSTQQQPVMPGGAQATQSHQYIMPTNAGMNFQNTIDPQFLTALQEAAGGPQSSQNQFLFYNPNASSYERPNDPKCVSRHPLSQYMTLTSIRAYQVFPDNLAQLNAEQLNARQHLAPGLMGQLPHLAPYPIAPGMLGMLNLFPLIDLCILTPLIAPNGAPKPAAQVASPRKRGRPRKYPLKTPNEKARSESVSDTSDSELEVEEPDEPSPLPAVRPTDSEGAVQYDTIKAIWSPRNKYPSVEKIKNALVAFKDVVKTVRDEWKSLSQAMKDAENQNNNDKASELRNKVVQQRKLINAVITTAIDKGHPVIVEKYVLFLPLLTPLAHHSYCISRIWMQNAHIYDVIISKCIVSELKKIVNCQARHDSSTGHTQMCAVSSLLPKFANKTLRLHCMGNAFCRCII